MIDIPCIVLKWYACFFLRKDNHLTYKDAVFFSVHKFIGGVQTPGEQFLGLCQILADFCCRDALQPLLPLLAL